MSKSSSNTFHFVKFAFLSFDHLGDIDDDTGPHDHQPAERAGADLGEVLLVISTLEQAFLKLYDLDIIFRTIFIEAFFHLLCARSSKDID